MSNPKHSLFWMAVYLGNVDQVFGTLKAGLEEPLDGMGTAFSSSLFGLGGSLVLGFLDLPGERNGRRVESPVSERED